LFIYDLDGFLFLEIPEIKIEQSAGGYRSDQRKKHNFLHPLTFLIRKMTPHSA
jgi:hypothetical protein